MVSRIEEKKNKRKTTKKNDCASDMRYISLMNLLHRMEHEIYRQNRYGNVKEAMKKSEEEFIDGLVCCGRTFSSYSEYIRHKDILHVGSESTDVELSKRYFCTFDMCTCIFTSSKEFLAHIEENHNKKNNDVMKKYVCEFENCQKRYKNANGLKYHMVHFHNQIFKKK